MLARTIGLSSGAFVSDFHRPVADNEIAATRVFDAPRKLVFEMFANPEHLAHWWGPRGFTTTTSRREFRPGGVWRYVMHGPDGTDYQNVVTYEEIAAGRLLRYRHGGGGDTESVRFDVTITFADDPADARRTRVEWRMVFPSKAARDFVADKYGAVDGLRQTIDRLAERLLDAVKTRSEPVLTDTSDGKVDQ